MGKNFNPEKFMRMEAKDKKRYEKQRQRQKRRNLRYDLKLLNYLARADEHRPDDGAADIVVLGIEWDKAKQKYVPIPPPKIYNVSWR